MIAPTVQLRDVRLRLGPRFTLDVAELTFPPGITTVLGANGSGKTTLLRLVATAIDPDAGHVTVGGRVSGGADCSAADLVAVRSMLGYLPQDDSVPRRLRVFDHVDLVAVAREIAPDARTRRAAVARALDAVDLVPLATERCGRLSGGERRRVALAAALAGEPSLLVLDEPDAGLDASQLDALAASLQRRGPHATIVVATHDQQWAAQLTTRVVRVSDGRTTT